MGRTNEELASLLFPDLPNQIPQKGGFSPPGRAQNQNGAGSVRRPLGDSRKISRDTDAQRADFPNARYDPIFADHLSAQTNAVTAGGGKIPLRCCRRRPWRISAGGVDAVIQVFPADTAPQPAAFPAQNQLRRHPQPKPQLLQSVFPQPVHLRPKSWRQDGQQLFPCAHHLHHSCQRLCGGAQ